MILIEKNGSETTCSTPASGVFQSCLNWSYIDKSTFPSEFTHSNVEENFDLLFRDQIDTSKLKETFRTSPRDPQQAVRKFLWKRILVTTGTVGPDQYGLVAKGYNSKASLMFGRQFSLRAELPDFVCKQHLVYYYLNDDGKGAVSRLLNVLAAAHPDITYAPLLLPLASLFLHYMSESDSYACLMAVVESKNKITQTDIHWLTTNNVFRYFKSLLVYLTFLKDFIFDYIKIT